MILTWDKFNYFFLNAGASAEYRADYFIRGVIHYLHFVRIQLDYNYISLLLHLEFGSRDDGLHGVEQIFVRESVGVEYRCPSLVYLAHDYILPRQLAVSQKQTTDVISRFGGLIQCFDYFSQLLNVRTGAG